MIHMAMHIFVVDDNETNLQVAGHILRKDDYRVTVLGSGRELLAQLTPADLPDLILLDIKMPEMDGFAALSHLRAKEQSLGIPEIPVIFLTADETADTEKQGFEGSPAEGYRHSDGKYYAALGAERRTRHPCGVCIGVCERGNS